MESMSVVYKPQGLDETDMEYVAYATQQGTSAARREQLENLLLHSAQAAKNRWI